MQVLSRTGDIKRQVELPDEVFGQEVREGLLWSAIRTFLANQRQGTAKAKSRAEVSGTGKKPYRQKHTGRARHGSRRTPIHTGGGVNFPPRPRDYSLGLPKKMRRQALHAALSARHAEEAIFVIEDFKVEQGKTKVMVEALAPFEFPGSVLLLPDAVNEEMLRASRNLPWLTVMPARLLHAYATLKHDQVVFTESGLKSFLESTGRMK